MIITGLTGAFVANYALAHSAGGSTAPFWLGYQAWRWMFWMQMIPAAVYFLARSEEHTSELQSLMRISYAVFCLKKQNHDLKTKKYITVMNMILFRHVDKTDHDTEENRYALTSI